MGEVTYVGSYFSSACNLNMHFRFVCSFLEFFKSLAGGKISRNGSSQQGQREH